MKPKEAAAFRKARVRELLLLADILESAGVGSGPLVRDAGPLRSAAGQCGDGDGTAWGYELVGLEFNLTDGVFSHTRPMGAALDSVKLSVVLSGPCLDADVKDDPFEKLNVNIVVTGLDTAARPLVTAWHLDKHEGGESTFHHPAYHVHCGGEKVWAVEQNTGGFSYGSLLLLESPRLDHKPFDGILAVDFVLGNFLGPEWRKLQAEPNRYAELILEAEQRCYRAYYETALARLRGRF